MSRKVVLPVLIGVLSLLTAGITGGGDAWAQSAPGQEEEPELRADEVVVTASRLADVIQELKRVPGQVYVITSQEIQEQNARTVQDALRQVPGIVQFNQVGNTFQPTVDLRGFNSQPSPAISVFVDGVRINDPDSNTVNFDLIPIQDVERIEVLPGATAVFGANAIGGVINIVTKRGGRSPQATGEAAWGSYNHYRLRGSVSGPIKDFDYYVSGTWDRESGYRDFSDGRVTTFTGKVGYRPSEATNLSLTYGYVNDHLEQAGTLPQDVLHLDRKANISPTDFSATEQSTVTFQGTQRLPWGFSLTGNAYYRDTSRDLQTVGLSTSGRAFTDTGTPGGALQVSHELKLWGFRNSLVFGGELRHSGINTQSTTTFGPTQRLIDEDTYGAYAQDSLDLLPNLTITGAVRYDVTEYEFEDEITPTNNGSKDFYRLTPRAGLTYTPWEVLTLYFNYGQGFRVPTTDELFAFQGLGSNPNLKPVTSQTFEVGLRARPLKWLETSAAFFLTDVENEIVFLPDPTGVTFGQNQNAPESRRQGVEIGAMLRPHQRVDVQLNYSYTDARYTSQAVLFGGTINPGDRVALVPLHRVYGRLAVRPLEGLELSVDGTYVGRQVLVDNETNQTSFRLQDYFVLNAQASYTWKYFTLFVQGFNLTDAAYESYGIFAFDPRTFTNGVFLMPAPGVNFLAGLRIQFKDYY
jgi:iron complex outermembrane receptor protein